MIALSAAAHDLQEQHTPTNAPVLYETPKDMSAAMKLPQASQWLEAYLAERAQLKNLQVYDVVELPEMDKHGKQPHVLKSKVVFKVKYLANGDLDKFKCRIVCTGYNMIFGEQYRETFAPVASIATVRIFLSWTTQHAMHARCIDISGAYCKAEMDDEYQIYMHPPKGCEEGTGPNGRPNVWILRKYLYGLKSSGWAWHRKLYTYLIKIGFRACPQDPCLLQRTTEREFWNTYLFQNASLSCMASL